MFFIATTCGFEPAKLKFSSSRHLSVIDQIEPMPVGISFSIVHQHRVCV
jgi:hypothetical protein